LRLIAAGSTIHEVEKSNAAQSIFERRCGDEEEIRR
jgi:hypothetical protein